MRDCPFAGCNGKVAGANFCCSKHWHAMSRDYRDQAFNAYRKYCNNECTVGELVEEQFRIADECSFKSSAVHGTDIYQTCAACGVVCFAVNWNRRTLLLDTLDCGDFGDFVVQGGVAFNGPDATRKIVSSPALAKLRRHVCVSRCQQPVTDAKEVAIGRDDAAA